jgi:WD40 repeat protein
VQPTSTERWRIMRVPLAGGRPEEVLATAGVAFPRCAVRGRCVLFEPDGDRWIISSLDPVRGKGERLCSIPFDNRGEDLSPDGSAVALVVEGSHPASNCIRIYSLRGELQKEVVVESASFLAGLDWAPSGAGFFSGDLVSQTRTGPAFSPRTWRFQTRSDLLFIRLDGSSRVLWSQQGAPVFAVPSPDGTHLAIAGWTRQSNVWMLTDF